MYLEAMNQTCVGLGSVGGKIIKFDKLKSGEGCVFEAGLDVIFVEDTLH